MRIVSGLSKFFRKWRISNEYLLKGPVSYRQSPNVGDYLPLDKKPLYIILHYTATLNAHDAIEILCDPQREVSAHLVIDRDGGVTQLVPFNRIAWHAGKSEWRGVQSINKCSIGIEVVNGGKLEKRDSCFYTWDSKIVPKEDVFRSIENSEVSYWHAYTFEQKKVLEEILKCLSQYYVISEILGHADISPDRKIDPGPELSYLRRLSE